MEGIRKWLPLIGYMYVSVVAFISALHVDNDMLMIMLIISAVVSLALALTRLISSRKMAARIKHLEEHHLSVSYDEENEGLIIKEGLL